jgi:hypothetical protein|tara:strand:- start:1254 stop:2147 length:894 start_codon:yes stop_codon:yes gene_type:complete
MPIEAKQTKNSNWDYEVVQERLKRPNGKQSKIFSNVRTDTGEELGYSTERYGIVQNADLLSKAESAFDSRGIKYERNVYATNDGAKLRAVYDLQGEQFRTTVPMVGDVMNYRLTVQNSFDRTLRVSFALGLMRLVCLNGMQTMEKDIDMVSKHSTKLNLDNLITDSALDNALAFLKESGNVYGQLAATKLDDEKGLNILTNLTKKKVMSEKVRERVAGIWSNREDLLRTNNTDPNLYNLYNSVTQHLTDEVEGTRFEYSNRIGTQVLRSFEAALRNPKRLTSLVKPVVDDSQIVVTE